MLPLFRPSSYAVRSSRNRRPSRHRSGPGRVQNQNRQTAIEMLEGRMLLTGYGGASFTDQFGGANSPTVELQCIQGEAGTITSSTSPTLELELVINAAPATPERLRAVVIGVFESDDDLQTSNALVSTSVWQIVGGENATDPIATGTYSFTLQISPGSGVSNLQVGGYRDFDSDDNSGNGVDGTPNGLPDFTPPTNAISIPFSITVNQEPTIDNINNLTIDEDADEQTVNLSGITAGGAESQELRVTASSNRTGLIPNPVVTYTSPGATGTLRFTPVTDQNDGNQGGPATITVTVEDDGPDDTFDTADDMSTTETFTVSVTALPEPPGTLSFAIDSGTGGDNITNDLTPEFSGTAEAGVDVRVERTDTDELIGMTTANGSGMFTIPFAGATPLTDGETVSFVAIPSVGGEDGPPSPALSLTFDTTPPQNVVINSLATDSGAQSDDAVTSDTTPVFSGMVDSGEPNGPVTITVNRVDNMNMVVEAVGTATASAAGAWTTTGFTGTALTDLEAFNVIATAADAAGNSSDSAPFAVVIDDRDPTLANLVLDGADNLFADSVLSVPVTDSMDPTIRFDLTEQLFPGGQNVLVEVFRGNSTDAGDLLNMTTVSFADTATPADSTQTDQAIVATGFGSQSGRQTLTLRATDLAGNNENAAIATLQVFVTDPGAPTPDAPNTPVLTDVYDLSAILDDGVDDAPSQVWQMGFDKTTQTIWINTELGNRTFQIDPATGAVNRLDLSLLVDNIANAGNPEIVSVETGLSVATDQIDTAPDPDEPLARPGLSIDNPHGIFFDFDTAQTPRIWIAHRTAGGADAVIQAGQGDEVEGGRLSYYDLVSNEFVTYEFSEETLPDLDEHVEDLHAVFVDDAGVIWTIGTHSNVIFEVRVNTLDPTDREAIVIPHMMPEEMGLSSDDPFDPHGIDVIVDERTGEKHVWLIAEGGSGRIALLRPHIVEDDDPGSNDDIDDDVWITWDMDSGENSRGTFLKVDDNETPGIPDDDVIVGTFPVGRGGNPRAFAGILQVLDPGSIAMDPSDVSEAATLTTFSIDQIPGGTSDLSAINQPYLDREGNIYFIDRAGAIGRIDRDGLAPVGTTDLTAIIVEDSPEAPAVFPDPSDFGSNTGPTQVFDASPLLTDMGLVAPPVELDDATHQVDRSQTAGLDLYEVANDDDGVRAQGRGVFRGAFNATSVLYSSLAQNDDVGSTAFSETTRRRISVVTSDGDGRMAFQTMRNGSLLMTSRRDGELFDEQVNLTREIVLRDGIDTQSVLFDAIAFDGDPSALRESDGAVHVFGRNVNNNVVVYEFDAATGLWDTSEVNSPNGTVLVGNPVAFNDGDRGPAAVATTASGTLLLYRPDGTVTDLTVLASNPDTARVYANPAIVDDVSGGRIYVYGADMSGNMVQYRFDRTGNIGASLVADTLVVPGSARAAGQAERDTRIVQDVDVVINAGTRHVFATDGHSRLVHWEVSGDDTVDLAENVSALIADTTDDNTVAANGSNIDTNGDDRVTGYFAFQMPFVARVYSEVAPVVEPDGSLTVYGTNGGDLVLFLQQSGEWHAANLSKDANPADDPAVFTPANFVFGASGAYLDSNMDRHSLQINGKAEVVEYTFDRSTGRFSTQNINLARSNSIADLTSLDAPVDLVGGATETIIDDGAGGYSLVLGNSANSTASGFLGDSEILGGSAGPNDGSSIAQWEFSGLAAGSYRVSATWTANANNAGNSVFVVIADESTAGQVRVNQQQTPEDFTNNGAFWQDLLTTVEVNDGTLTVLLGDDANGQVIADAIRIERVDTLQVAGGAAAESMAVGHTTLRTSDIAPSFDEAVAILTATFGLTPQQIAELDALNPLITDLSGGVLGGVSGDQLLLDLSAAGFGWHIDATPGDHEEFAASDSGELQALAGSAATGRIDLLTVLLHELSHVLGQEHSEASEHSLLSDELAIGTRRLPVADSAATENPSEVDEQFATGDEVIRALNRI